VIWDEIRKNVMRWSGIQLALVVLAFIVTTRAPAETDGGALASLVDAEKRFASLSEEIGWRKAFIANFADEGINFTPHPTRTKERLSSQPPPSSPPKTILHWRPVYSDISAAGDIGYNTGPFWITNETGEVKPQGYFFSVWKKQRDGSWKVVVDVGVDMPLTDADLSVAWKAASSPAYKPTRQEAPSEQTAYVTEMERGFSKSGLPRLLAENTRLHTPNKLPIVSKEGVLDYWRQQGVDSISWQPIVVESANSADLAYSYGSYTHGKPAAGGEKGYYTHVWKRNLKGDWQLAVEVLSPLPVEKK
jgi:ketosteroid isomerase-like protein